MGRRDFYNLSPTQGKKVYILSSDLPVIVSQWLARDFSFQNFAWGESRRIFKKVKKTLVALLKNALGPQVEIKYISTHLAYGRLHDLLRNDLDTPWISLDPVNTRHLAENTFQMDVTRIVKHASENKDNSWEPIGHGPRNPVVSVPEQVEQLRRRKNVKEVIVIDDGIWTAETMRAIETLLRKQGISVKKFVVFFNLAPANHGLTAPVEQIFSVKREDVVDWTYERDFLPGLPFSGRTVGTKIIEQADAEDHSDWPFRSVPMQGNYSAPYLELLGDPHGWASIPNHKLTEFSIGCLGLAIAVYRAIESAIANGMKLKVHQVPFMYKSKLDRPMTAMLSDTIHRIRQAHMTSIPNLQCPPQTDK
jgi:hypothetical protein